MTPCAHCGEDIARHGTTLDAELFIEDRGFAISPSFCSWQHAAAWFNQAPPDISAWRQNQRKGPADGGMITWFILLALIILLLGTVVVLMATVN